MKKAYSILILLLIFSTSIINAQKMKIVRCTTPTITINGKKCAVGDTFDKNDNISWTSFKQVLIAKDEKGQLVRFAAPKSTENESLMTTMLNTQHKELATRGFETVNIDGKYIIDGELALPTGLKSGNKYNVELTYTIKGESYTYKAKLSADNSTMLIKKNIFKGETKEIIKPKIVAYDQKNCKRILISNKIEFTHIDRAMMPE